MNREREALLAAREAVEQAIDCIMGEQPEDCTVEEAKQDTLSKLRSVDTQITAALEAKPEEKYKTEIQPRIPTEYTLDDFHRATCNEGPLAYQYEDKPHRLVYDLIAWVAALAPQTKLIAVPNDPVDATVEIPIAARITPKCFCLACMPKDGEIGRECTAAPITQGGERLEGYKDGLADAFADLRWQQQIRKAALEEAADAIDAEGFTIKVHGRDLTVAERHAVATLLRMLAAQPAKEE